MVQKYQSSTVIITIDAPTPPPAVLAGALVHHTELDVTQIRRRVRAHTALNLSYLREALLQGGSIA